MQFERKTRRISRSRWAIKIPKRPKGQYHFDQDTYNGMAYEEAEQLLEGLGFERQFQREGLKHGDLRFAKAGVPFEEHPEIHALWAHPAGVLIKMSSYRLTDGRKGPVRRKLSSMDVTLQLDSGSFRGNYLKTLARELSATGGTTPQLHGTNTHYKSFRVGAIGDRGLLNILEVAQAHTRLLPFEQWVEKGMHTYLDSSQMWFFPGIVEEDFGQEGSIVSKKYRAQARAVIDAASVHMMPGVVAEIRAEQAFNDTPDKTSRSLASQTWHKAEQTINYFQHTLEVAGICWPTSEQARILSTWTQMVADHGAVDDLSSAAVSQEGPAGLHYANALLCCVGRAGNAERFLDLIAHVDEAVLRRWVSVPDASGLTLVGQIVSVAGDPTNSTSMGISGTAAPLPVLMQSLEVLVERLGPQALSLGSAQLPLPALISSRIKPPQDNTSYDQGDHMLVERMGRVVEHALAIGIAVGPIPARVEADIAHLREHHGHWTGMGSILSALEQQCLAEAAEVSSGIRASRPRL